MPNDCPSGNEPMVRLMRRAPHPQKNICLSYPWRLPTGRGIRKEIRGSSFPPIHPEIRYWAFHFGIPGRHCKSHTMPAKRKRRTVLATILVARLVLVYFSDHLRPVIPSTKSAARYHRQRQDIKREYERKNPHHHKDNNFYIFIPAIASPLCLNPYSLFTR